MPQGGPSSIPISRIPRGANARRPAGLAPSVGIVGWWISELSDESELRETAKHLLFQRRCSGDVLDPVGSRRLGRRRAVQQALSAVFTGSHTFAAALQSAGGLATSFFFQ